MRANCHTVCTLGALDGTFISLRSLALAIQDVNGAVTAWDGSEGLCVIIHMHTEAQGILCAVHNSGPVSSFDKSLI